MYRVSKRKVDKIFIVWYNSATARNKCKNTEEVQQIDR